MFSLFDLNFYLEQAEKEINFWSFSQNWFDILSLILTLLSLWLAYYLGERGYKRDMYFVVASYISLQTAKTMVLQKLNRAENIGTFLKTSNGYRVTAPEGFVAIDRIGKALKLVDRLEFSRANFTANTNWK